MTPAPRPDPGREAWAAIATLFMGDENHDRFHRACEATGLTPPAMKALLSLHAGEARSMRTLADRWRCDASWVTSLVDSLEERNLVERHVLPTDRRVKTIVLTDAGAKARDAALEVLNEPPASMQALSRAERIQLRDLLAKFLVEQP